MTFGSPSLLILLVVLPLAAGVYWLAQRRRPRYTARFTNLALLANVMPRRPAWRRYLPPALYLLSLGALLVALAKPYATVKLPKQEGTVMLVMDVSGSMNARDVSPTRLSAAVTEAEHFVDQLPGRFKVGVVAFSGNAEVLTPPTSDRVQVRNALESMRANGGTAMGDGIERGLAFSRQNDQAGGTTHDFLRAPSPRGSAAGAGAGASGASSGAGSRPDSNGAGAANGSGAGAANGGGAGASGAGNGAGATGTGPSGPGTGASGAGSTPNSNAAGAGNNGGAGASGAGTGTSGASSGAGSAPAGNGASAGAGGGSAAGSAGAGNGSAGNRGGSNGAGVSGAGNSAGASGAGGGAPVRSLGTGGGTGAPVGAGAVGGGRGTGGGGNVITNGKPMAMVLLSDGASNAGQVAPEVAAEDASQLHVPIYTIALGTATGTLDLRVGNRLQRIAVPPDPAILKKVAQISGGRFFAAPSDQDLHSIYDNLATKLGFDTQQQDVTPLFIGAAAVLLMLGGGLATIWFHRFP